MRRTADRGDFESLVDKVAQSVCHLADSGINGAFRLAGDLPIQGQRILSIQAVWC